MATDRLDMLLEYDPDEVQPWDRQPWDTPTSFDRFRRFFLSLPLPRSVNQAYRDWKKYEGADVDEFDPAPTIWRMWSQGKDVVNGTKPEGVMTWKERGAAWDLHLAKVSDATKIRRAIEVAEADYQAGQGLRDLAAAILQNGPSFLKHSTRTVKGKTKTIVGADGQKYEVQVTPDREVITMALNVQAAVQSYKLASDLQRKSADMSDPVQRHALTDAEGEDILPAGDVIEALRNARAELDEADGSRPGYMDNTDESELPYKEEADESGNTDD